MRNGEKIIISSLKKKATILLTVSLVVLLMGCSASVKSYFSEQRKPLTIEDKVAFLDVKNAVPEGAIKIGGARYGDTGFSTDCDFNSNLNNARKLARANGANIVKVVEKKEPTLFGSSCYRIKVDFYFYEGDVSKLQQYQLQIN